MKQEQVENTECPRCHKKFICRADNIQLCDCTKLGAMTPHLKQFLAENFDDGICLCYTCLVELNVNWST